MSEESIVKSDSNSALTYVDHHLLPYVNFNGHCLIKSNISIPTSIHFFHTRSTIKKFQHRFYIR